MKKGSITIEATFIIPVCFFCMIAFLYIGMYLHDCYTIETVIRTATQREMRYILQEETIEEGEVDWEYWKNKTIIWSLIADWKKEKRELKKYIEKSLERKLLLAEKPILTIEMSTNRIMVSYESKVQWSMNFLKMLIERESGIKGKIQVDMIEPQEWIRMCRGLLGI